MSVRSRLCLISLLLLGWRPIYERHDTPDRVSDEFKNVEDNLQDQQYFIYPSTPNLTDLKDGQIVLFSSGAHKIMWRDGNDIFTIQGSCITIRR